MNDPVTLDKMVADLQPKFQAAQRHPAGTAPVDHHGQPHAAHAFGFGGFDQAALLRTALSLGLGYLRDDVVHLDQPSVDQVKGFNPGLGENLQRLLDLFNAAQAAV